MQENPVPKGPYVLFADDEPDILGALCAWASAFGIRADSATNPDEILERVNQHCGVENDCYDVLVLDINYANQPLGQRKTGILALNEIRKKYRNLPVLVLTGFPAPLTRENAVTLNAEVVNKPVDMEALMERILYLARFGNQAIRPEEDRRKASMNRTPFRRRRTDRPLEFPESIQEAQRSAKGQGGSK